MSQTLESFDAAYRDPGTRIALHYGVTLQRLALNISSRLLF
jgi:hypothetical protein